MSFLSKLLIPIDISTYHPLPTCTNIPSSGYTLVCQENHDGIVSKAYLFESFLYPSAPIRKKWSNMNPKINLSSLVIFSKDKVGVVYRRMGRDDSIVHVAWWYYEEGIFVTQDHFSIKKAKTLEKRPNTTIVQYYLAWYTIDTHEALASY